MINGGFGFIQAACHQLIITYQTATGLENAAGDFGFFQCHSTRFVQIKRRFGSICLQVGAMNLSLGVFVMWTLDERII